MIEAHERAADNEHSRAGLVDPVDAGGRERNRHHAQLVRVTDRYASQRRAGSQIGVDGLRGEVARTIRLSKRRDVGGHVEQRVRFARVGTEIPARGHFQQQLRGGHDVIGR